MKNLEIRESIKKNRLFHYEIAEFLGISESALSKWFRTEMDPEKTAKILQAIEYLRRDND
ncbi:MAG: hypothetical protein U0N90_02930 [Blautia sp.]|jgi:DNA-binding transcriptional regulator YiaG